MDEILSTTAKALQEFEAELVEAGMASKSFERDPEGDAWQLPFVFELSNDPTDTFDALCSLQIVDRSWADGSTLYYLQWSFFLFDDLNVPESRSQRILSELTALNMEVGVKWTPVFEKSEITGICAVSENIVHTVTAEFLSETFNALLVLVTDAYENLLVLTEKAKS